MSNIKSCTHINQITDEHEGFIVCTDCGLVLHQVFTDIKTDNNYSKENEPYHEFINRLNIQASQNSEDCNTTCLTTIASNLYLNINKTSSVSLKEIISATGANEKKLVKKTRGHTTILNKNILLEKYCSQLDINYKNYTLIKESIEKIQLSGHNPLTVIASAIYAFCKTKKLKISMKKVALTTGISCISIQRFLKHFKNELSYGC